MEKGKGRKELTKEEIMEKEDGVKVQGENGEWEELREELREKGIKMDFGRRVRKRTE